MFSVNKIYVMMTKSNFQQPLLQSSVSHDPSETPFRTQKNISMVTISVLKSVVQLNI